MDQSAHPSIETLELYLTKRIPEEERSSIREHVIACAECQRTITSYLAVKLGLLRLGPHEPIWLDLDR
jgi:hypothetical protein